MVMLLAIGGWLVFSILAAVVARIGAVKFAEKRGWTALTMPMSYHVWLITAYLVLVYGGWIVLHFIFLT
jgi:hypothetical protein